MYCKLHLLQEVMKRILSDRYKASINYHLTCSTIRNAVIYYFIYNGSSSFVFNAYIFHYVLFCYQYHPYHHYYHYIFPFIWQKKKRSKKVDIIFIFDQYSIRPIWYKVISHYTKYTFYYFSYVVSEMGQVIKLGKLSDESLSN